MKRLPLFILAFAYSIAKADKIDDLVHKTMSDKTVPGIALAIIPNDRKPDIRCYGLANIEHQVKVKPSTVFQLGSVGKQFTSTLILKEVELGRLSLDDSVTKYLPESKGKWDDVKIRHLLSHSSGLPDLPYGQMDMRKDYTEKELVEFMLNEKVVSPPGEKWRYNNGGYVMLGVVAGRVGSKFYGDQLQEYVFKPLKMASTRIITESDIVMNRAAGYEKTKDGLKNQDWVAPQLNTTADGSIYTTIEDMVKWANALRTSTIVKRELWEQSWKPQFKASATADYGFGWVIRKEGKKTIIEHGGAWQGFRSAILRSPDDKLTIVVLSNCAAAEPEKLANSILAEKVKP